MDKITLGLEPKKLDAWGQNLKFDLRFHSPGCSRRPAFGSLIIFKSTDWGHKNNFPLKRHKKYQISKGFRPPCRNISNLKGPWPSLQTPIIMG